LHSDYPDCVSDNDPERLEAAETWSDDEGVVRPTVKTQRAIVSVAFTREDLDRVSGHAERQGMKTWKFIRNAALAEVASKPQRVRILSVNGSFRTVYVPSMLRAPRVEVRMDQPDRVMTR